jgi:hypothetical protein
MPGWKRDVGRRLDALIARTVPNVRKAVKWNSPFYGVEGPRESQTWFLSFHCFTKIREGDVPPRHVAASRPAGRVEAEGRTIPRHPRGRCARGKLNSSSG